MRAGFEWLVAWRHLRDPRAHKSHRTLMTGLVAAGARRGWRSLFAVAAPALLGAARAAPGGVAGGARGGLAASYVAIGGRVAIGARRHRRRCWACCSPIFTVFTALSIFGVFLGTAAPIIALSVMSGFENDLKTKIRVDQGRRRHRDARRPPVHRLAGGGGEARGIPGIVGRDGLRRGRGDREARDQPGRHGDHPARHRSGAGAARARPRAHAEGGEGRTTSQHPEQIPNDSS